MSRTSTRLAPSTPFPTTTHSARTSLARTSLGPRTSIGGGGGGGRPSLGRASTGRRSSVPAPLQRTPSLRTLLSTARTHLLLTPFDPTILLLIAAHLPRADLVALLRVNSAFYWLIMPSLYTHLILPSHTPWPRLRPLVRPPREFWPWLETHPLTSWVRQVDVLPHSSRRCMAHTFEHETDTEYAPRTSNCPERLPFLPRVQTLRIHGRALHPDERWDGLVPQCAALQNVRPRKLVLLGAPTSSPLTSLPYAVLASVDEYVLVLSEPEDAAVLARAIASDLGHTTARNATLIFAPHTPWTAFPVLEPVVRETSRDRDTLMRWDSSLRGRDRNRDRDLDFDGDFLRETLRDSSRSRSRSRARDRDREPVDWAPRLFSELGRALAHVPIHLRVVNAESAMPPSSVEEGPDTNATPEPATLLEGYLRDALRAEQAEYRPWRRPRVSIEFASMPDYLDDAPDDELGAARLDEWRYPGALAGVAGKEGWGGREGWSEGWANGRVGGSTPKRPPAGLGRSPRAPGGGRRPPPLVLKPASRILSLRTHSGPGSPIADMAQAVARRASDKMAERRASEKRAHAKDAARRAVSEKVWDENVRWRG